MIRKAFFCFIISSFIGCSGNKPDLDSEYQSSSVKEQVVKKQIPVIYPKNSNSGPWMNPDKLDTVLVFSENLKLALSKTDSTQVDDYCIHSSIVDSLHQDLDNSHLKALAIESYMNKLQGDFFRRDSVGLSLKLENGRWKRIVLDSMSDEADHTFEEFLPQFGYYIIRVQWGEGNGYKLVNYQTGEVFSIWGRPWFSPNGEFIIVTNSDFEAHYSENGFQLFRNKNGTVDLIGEFSPESWGCVSAKWSDSETIILKNRTMNAMNSDLVYMDFFSELRIIK